MVNWNDDDSRTAEADDPIIDIIRRLRKLGVVKVEASYDGYEDSRNMDDIYSTDKAGNEICLPSGFVDTIADYVWSTVPAGCENNAGCQGTCNIDVDARTVEFDHQDRYTELNDNSFSVKLPPLPPKKTKNSKKATADGTSVPPLPELGKEVGGQSGGISGDSQLV